MNLADRIVADTERWDCTIERRSDGDIVIRWPGVHPSKIADATGLDEELLEQDHQHATCLHIPADIARFDAEA